jgi:transposase
MGEYSELFVAFDVAKKKHAVAIAEGGRRGEIRFVGEIENSPATIERMIKKLAALCSTACLLRSRSDRL